MKDLILGKVGRSNFTTPADIVTESVAIFGIKGAGKSSTTRVVVEELAKQGLPVVVFDPKGDWWGITSNAKGNGEGLPFYILGGDHGHAPLEFTGGSLVADFVIDNPAFYILDLSDMRKGQQRRFFTDFAERLYWRKRKERDAMMVVVDESDLFAPQSTFGTDDRDYSPARMVGAAEDLVRRGRQRGIGSMWPTQRPASLHTGVRTQCSTLICMRMSGSHDVKAIDEWVKANGTDAQRDVMMAALASQDTGVGFVWSPHFLRCFEQVHFRMMETFDSFATPRAGQRLVEPKVRAEVDLTSLTTAMKETIDKAKENDPKALKAELARLRVELDRADERTRIERHRADAAEEREANTVVEIHEVPKPYIPEEMAKLISDFGQGIEALANLGRRMGNVVENVGTDHGVVKVTEGVRDFPRELAHTRPYEEAKPRAAVTTPQPAPGESDRLPKAERAILITLAQFGKQTLQQISIRTGYALGGGGFNNALGALRSKGYILKGTEPEITSEGMRALGPFDPLPTGRALLDHWLNNKKTIGGRAGAMILSYVHSQYPRAVPQEEIQRETGYAPGGGFNNALGRLRTLELVERGKDVRCSEAFFA